MRMGPYADAKLDEGQEDADAQKRAEQTAVVDRAKKACQADTAALTDIFQGMADDLEAVVGGERSWDKQALTERKRFKRPVVTSHRLKAAAKQVTGEVYKSRPSIRCAPADGAADPRTADVFEGIIRHIENRSMAQVNYPMLVQSATHCGRGHMRLSLKWSDEGKFDTPQQLERAFDVEIIQQLISNQFAVRWDKDAKDPLYADAERCTVYAEVDEGEFKEAYPEAGAAGWAAASKWASSQSRWTSAGKIPIAEFWEVKKEPVRVVQMRHDRASFGPETFDTFGQPIARQAIQPSGETTALADPSPEILAEAQAGGWSIVQERVAHKRSICMHLLGGSDVLAGPIYWPGQRIPIFTCHGEVMHVGEERIEHGIARDAIPDQRRLNLALSIETELVGTAPLNPYLVEDKMIQGYEDEWVLAARQPAAYLRYKPGTNGAKPERVQPIPGNPGLQQMAANATDGVKATTGFYDASLGARSNETSGVAIDARDEQSDTGAYVYGANLAATLQAMGQEMVNVIPAVYSQRQMVAILGRDNTPDIVNLEEMRAQGLGLDIGKYQVICSQGVNYQTQRDKDNDLLAKAADTSPDPFKPIFFKRLIANTQLDDKDEIIAEIEAVGQMTGLLPPSAQAPGMPGAPPMPGMPPGMPMPPPGGPMPLPPEAAPPPMPMPAPPAPGAAPQSRQAAFDAAMDEIIARRNGPAPRGMPPISPPRAPAARTRVGAAGPPGM
jgi:hypothetical protein